ncbi:hypothetical protein MRX96_022996 [Rhipicephalus microplus]
MTDDVTFVKGQPVSLSGYPSTTEPTPHLAEADIRQPCRLAFEPVPDKNQLIQTANEGHADNNRVVFCTTFVIGQPGFDKLEREAARWRCRWTTMTILTKGTDMSDLARIHRPVIMN